MVAIKVKSMKVFLCWNGKMIFETPFWAALRAGWGGQKKEIYLFTKGLCVWMTRDWEPDSSARAALRCDLTTLCQRLPSRLIIWLAALTKMVGPWDQPVTNPCEPTISHPLVCSASLWKPPADFHVVFHYRVDIVLLVRRIFVLVSCFCVSQNHSIGVVAYPSHLTW